MCSRYYIDPGMTEDISRVVQNIDGRIWLAQGDTRPTDVAPVIGQSEHGLGTGYVQMGISPVKRQKFGHQCKGGNCHGINLPFRTESYITGC